MIANGGVGVGVWKHEGIGKEEILGEEEKEAESQKSSVLFILPIVDCFDFFGK